jgi:hypothetical protein
MRYFQSMHYRDWSLPVQGGITLAPGASGTFRMVLYTRSIPSGTSAASALVHLYLYVQTDGPVRFSFGSSQVDLTETGIAYLLIPGNQLPGIASYFGNFGGPAYYDVYITATNIGNAPVTFRIRHYQPFIDYTSLGVPNPVYHGTEPDSYNRPDAYFLATRFVYRGVRSAFPFMTMLQNTTQGLGTAMVSASIAPVQASGMKSLVSAILRRERMFFRDGVYGGV